MICVDSTVLDKSVVSLEVVRHSICTNNDEIVQWFYRCLVWVITGFGAPEACKTKIIGGPDD